MNVFVISILFDLPKMIILVFVRMNCCQERYESKSIYEDLANKVVALSTMTQSILAREVRR